jgi:argininosuccinate lyase
MAQIKESGAGMRSAEEQFPAPIYAETVLAPNFEDAKRFFLHSLIQMHYAHTLMLAKQEIISRDEARACLKALDTLDLDRVKAARYDGTYEDLFFFVEQELANSIGADLAGKMHTARSRNDIDLTLYRMAVRAEVLRIAECLLTARAVLLELAEANIDTVMPGYTHTQPAQPTTLAHYLMAAVEFLGRDLDRVRACWSTVNRNPLGACAITTTGFPIDRNYTAELLGFEGLQTNSYGAIAAVDYVTECAGAVAVSMINLGKHVQDLLQWCMAEFGFLRLSNAYVQTSSIMPQKRNPVSLEHTRIIASKAFSQAQAVMTCAHNTPFGDIVDSEDDLQPLVFAMFTDASRALSLFAGVMRNCEVNREHMALRAQSDFLAVTELADTLVRSEGLSFRLAHRLVHSAVVACGKYDRERMVDEVVHLAPQIIGRSLNIQRAALLEALDAVHFIAIRDIPGGPARRAVEAEIAATRTQMKESEHWLKGKQMQEREFPQKIEKAKNRILDARH